MCHKYYRSFLVVCVCLLLAACGVYESSPLIVSIRSNDAYSVKSLIKSGEDVNALSLDLIGRHYWELTPLIRASIAGNIEIIEMLLEAGADVNGKDEWGDTALMATAEFGHANAARLLIESEADVDATKPGRTTALMIAARRGNLEITKILIDAGADVNIGLGGDTALSLAAWKGNVKIVETLLENGAIVHLIALYTWATENNHENIIRFIISREGSIINEIKDMSIEEKRTFWPNPAYRPRKLNDPCKFHSDCIGELMCINNVCTLLSQRLKTNVP